MIIFGYLLNNTIDLLWIGLWEAEIAMGCFYQWKVGCSTQASRLWRTAPGTWNHVLVITDDIVATIILSP